jgi:cysteine desulfurase
VIYLDNNATTKPSRACVEAMRKADEEAWFNPSSVHRAGQLARQQVELARRDIAELIGATPREITFTSGGTEAIDLALEGVLGALPSTRRELVTTEIEHAAIRDLGEELAVLGRAKVHLVAPGRDGLISPDALAAAITPGTGLISVQWANNETGAIQPVREIAAIARSRGVLMHIDATQWVGKEPASIRDADPSNTGDVSPWCDLITFAPHKFHGPKGVGVLWTHPKVRLRPRVPGSQELGRRGGTENVSGIVGAGVAAREAAAWLADPQPRATLAALRDQFEQRVLELCPQATMNGPHGKTGNALRLWNTTNIAFPRLEAEALLLMLSERGVCASAGAACSSGSLDPSPVLLAMGVPPELAHGSLRFSLSRASTPDEVMQAATIVGDCAQLLRRSLPT